MGVDLSKYLVVAISSTALFNLSKEHEIFLKNGLEEYKKYQLENENTIPIEGTGFPLIKAILHLNEITPGKRKTEVIIISKIRRNCHYVSIMQ